MAKKIVVASGKGGVGKSTLTAGLCCALANMGKTVMAMDGDIGLRSLDVILGVSDRVVFDWGDIILNRCEPIQAMIRTRGPIMIAAPLNYNEKFTGEAFKRVIASFEAYYDYVLIDSPAGISRGFRLAAAAADTGIIIATPDEVCVRSGAIAANELFDANVKDPRLIINRFDKKAVLKGKQLNIDQVIDCAGLQLIGVVPEDNEVAFCSVKGLPLPKESPAAKALDKIAQRLEGKNIPLKF